VKHPLPQFRLARVLNDGTKEANIVPVHQLPLDTKFGRRGFFQVGAA
jgi:hypothetical protein